MPEERDPLEAFKSAWRELEAPDATPEEGDAETEAAVEWMRQAWKKLEPPSPVVPFRLRVRPLRGSLPVLGRLAAAAAILALCTLLGRDFLSTGLRDGVALHGPEPGGARVIIEAPEEDALVMEHGSVRLVMLVSETTFEAFEPNGDLEQTRMENPK